MEIKCKAGNSGKIIPHQIVLNTFVFIFYEVNTFSLETKLLLLVESIKQRVLLREKFFSRLFVDGCAYNLSWEGEIERQSRYLLILRRALFKHPAIVFFQNAFWSDTYTCWYRGEVRTSSFEYFVWLNNRVYVLGHKYVLGLT